MTNIILGVGGTGAKIVESFVHLCAAGLGPPRAAVAFIDQDQSNGNTQRARKTLTQYATARKVLWDEDEPDCGLLNTELNPHPDANNLVACHWVPQPEGDPQFGQAYGLQFDAQGS